MGSRNVHKLLLCDKAVLLERYQKRKDYICSTQGIKTGSGGVCSHNADGRVRNRNPNPEADMPSDLTYCSHKPEYIVTTTPNRSVWITIITWHFQFHIVNVSILHSKYETGARSENRFSCYSHCYGHVVSLNDGNCRLTMPVGNGRCARDALLHIFEIGVFKTRNQILQ